MLWQAGTWMVHSVQPFRRNQQGELYVDGGLYTLTFRNASAGGRKQKEAHRAGLIECIGGGVYTAGNAVDGSRLRWATTLAIGVTVS